MRNLLAILCFFLVAAGSPGSNPEKSKMEAKTGLTLTILYDNYNYDENFKNSWGFACLIEGGEKTILFDTGGKDGNLMHNFKAAGKDPADVDLVVLSHIHWDHTGGLPEFLDYKTGIEVFIPASFPEDFKKEVIRKGSQPVEIEGSRKITEGVWTTGEMGEQIIEQSLIIETDKGLIILTGCAHPGIERIVEKSIAERGKNVLLVMGGFHLMRTGTGTVESIAKEFRKKNITCVAPTHCSGDGAISIFREIFGDHCIRVGTGKVINTADL